MEQLGVSQTYILCMHLKTDHLSRNGDPYFTAGPPKNDAVFKIQKIVMEYNPK